MLYRWSTSPRVFSYQGNKQRLNLSSKSNTGSAKLRHADQAVVCVSTRTSFVPCRDGRCNASNSGQATRRRPPPHCRHSQPQLQVLATAIHSRH